MQLRVELWMRSLFGASRGVVFGLFVCWCVEGAVCAVCLKGFFFGGGVAGLRYHHYGVLGYIFSSYVGRYYPTLLSLPPIPIHIFIHTHLKHQDLESRFLNFCHFDYITTPSGSASSKPSQRH